MSRAFIKEDAGDDELPEKTPPSGPNYVTPAGLDQLRAKVQPLQAKGTGLSKEERRDLRYWQARLGGAILVDNSKNPPPDIRFGAVVETRDASGATQRVHIVGQDEAQGGGEKISWDSVFARTLLGRRAGDKALRFDGDLEVELTIVSVRYG